LTEVFEGAAKVTLPCVCNGRLEKPGEVDSWTLDLKKGEILQTEVRGAALGSPLAAAVTLRDPSGKELAKVESWSNESPEGKIRYVSPRDETVTVEVRDLFKRGFRQILLLNQEGTARAWKDVVKTKSRGGPEYAYRLRLTKGEPAPDFRLSFKTDALTLLRES